MHGALGMVKPDRPLTAGKIKHLARQAELESKTGASGLTLLKAAWTASPIQRLVDSKQIGPEELQAARDISMAFLSIAGALIVRGQTWERIDKGQDGREPAAVLDAQRRYRNFASHWSMQRGRGDRTLEIIIEAVVDERPFYLIDAGLHLRHGLAKKATIRGLRDYAVRAGWVKGKLGDRWIAEASNTFIRWPLALIAAVARAKFDKRG